MPAKTKTVKRARPGVRKVAQLVAAIARFGRALGDRADTPRGYVSRRTQTILERLADARLALLDAKHLLERP